MKYFLKLSGNIFLVAGFVALVCTYAYGAEEISKGVESVLAKRWTGDWSALSQKRVIRVLVPYSKTYYFLDGARERGATYELLKEFEKFVNEELKTKHLKVHLLVIPTARDRLLPGLIEGAGDIAAGNLTITKNRLEEVDFGAPIASNVSEIIVGGTGGEEILSLEDLSGKTVHVRKSSSYFESLARLNEKFRKEGKPLIEIRVVSTYLEDEDLLEMVNAGVLPLMVVDSYKAKFWTQVFPDIVLYPQVKLNQNGKIAWAIRKNSPELQQLIGRFIEKHKIGTLFGNVVFNRYFKNTSFVKNNLAEKERKKFLQTVELFKKYGKQYNFDWLMLMALAYQESTIDQSKRSKAGAVGVMQILPSTAKDKNVSIAGIDKIEPNIQAGTKYIRFMVDRYFDDSELDDLNRGLFAFASYNAGPAKIASLRREAAEAGLDPNIWFRNVEVIAAKRIGRETVQYVSNIFKYYTAYKLIDSQSEKTKQDRINQVKQMIVN